MLEVEQTKDLLLGYDKPSDQTIIYGLVRRIDFNKNTAKYCLDNIAWFSELVKNTTLKECRVTFHLSDADIRSLLVNAGQDLIHEALGNVAYELDFDSTENYYGESNKGIESYIGKLIKYAVLVHVREYLGAHFTMSIEDMAEKLGDGKAEHLLTHGDKKEYDDAFMGFDDSEENIDGIYLGSVDDVSPFGDDDVLKAFDMVFDGEIEDDGDFDISDIQRSFDFDDTVLNEENDKITEIINGLVMNGLQAAVEEDQLLQGLMDTDSDTYNMIRGIVWRGCVSLQDGMLEDLTPYIVFAGAYYFAMFDTADGDERLAAVAKFVRSECLPEESEMADAVALLIGSTAIENVSGDESDDTAEESESGQDDGDNADDELSGVGRTSTEAEINMAIQNVTGDMLRFADAQYRAFGYTSNTDRAKDIFSDLFHKIGPKPLCRFCALYAGTEYFQLL